MEGTINIYNQLKNNYMCGIKYTSGFNFYTGFFCYHIKGKKKTVLITNWNAINQYSSFDNLILFLDNNKTQKKQK